MAKEIREPWQAAFEAPPGEREHHQQLEARLVGPGVHPMLRRSRRCHVKASCCIPQEISGGEGEGSRESGGRGECRGPGGCWGGRPSPEQRRGARGLAGPSPWERYLLRVPQLVSLVVTLCPQASERAVAWWRQVCGLQGPMFDHSGRAVPGSSPFCRGAGCVPVSRLSLHAKASAGL